MNRHWKISDTELKLIRAQRELEYVGYLVSRHGLKMNHRVVESVQQLPAQKTAQETWRFLGLRSYYQKFIPSFARIARPLHQLTCKNAASVWMPECHNAFEELKRKPATAPVLAYPDFGHEFVLETNASIQGIRAVLGQYQEDKQLHPVAYARRPLRQ